MMKRRRDAKGKKIRVTATLDPDVAPALERWRAQRRPIPKITQAVNDLLRKSLGLKKR